jgi:hypothetical protein
MYGTDDEEILKYSKTQKIAYYMCKFCVNLKFIEYRKFKDHVLTRHGEFI